MRPEELVRESAELVRSWGWWRQEVGRKLEAVDNFVIKVSGLREGNGDGESCEKRTAMVMLKV